MISIDNEKVYIHFVIFFISFTNYIRITLNFYWIDVSNRRKMSVLENANKRKWRWNRKQKEEWSSGSTAWNVSNLLTRYIAGYMSSDSRFFMDWLLRSWCWYLCYRIKKVFRSIIHIWFSVLISLLIFKRRGFIVRVIIHTPFTENVIWFSVIASFYGLIQAGVERSFKHKVILPSII